MHSANEPTPGIITFVIFLFLNCDNYFITIVFFFSFSTMFLIELRLQVPVSIIPIIKYCHNYFL